MHHFKLLNLGVLCNITVMLSFTIRNLHWVFVHFWIKEVFIYVHEVTFGKLPGLLRMGTGHHGNQSHDWRVGLFNLTP